MVLGLDCHPSLPGPQCTQCRAQLSHSTVSNDISTKIAVDLVATLMPDVSSAMCCDFCPLPLVPHSSLVALTLQLIKSAAINQCCVRFNCQARIENGNQLKANMQIGIHSDRPTKSIHVCQTSACDTSAIQPYQLATVSNVSFTHCAS